MSPLMLLHLVCHLTRRHLTKHIALTALTIHRLTLSSLRLTSKLLDDRTWTNERWAKVAGIDAKELSRLEVGFAFLIDWNIASSNAELCGVLHDLELGVR